MADIGDGKLISRDFKVYFTNIKSTDKMYDGTGNVTLGEYIDSFVGSPVDSLAELLAVEVNDTGGEKVFYEFGELRKDGFVSNLDDGETVQGNTKGEILISQAGTLTATMISPNKETLNQLAGMNGEDICVLAVSEDDRVLCFFYPDMRLNFNPSFTGGEVGSIEVTFTKDVACGDDWSTPFTTNEA